MAHFRIERRTPLPAGETWRRLTDWPRHGAQVPLSGVTVRPAGPTRVGTVVVVRTGVGRAGFDDPMEVVRWDPPADDTSAGGNPGVCRLEKRGSVVLGWAEIEVRPRDGGSEVVWREEARLRGLPRLFDPPTAWSGRLLFGRVVDALLKD
ncbi:SRPBCC family protein [Streptomyces antimycoticus]|uniref:SRPBCC family protein n=3 Tax=Streptomyces TaxID=1883 RepID=A0ABD5J7F5_9ACTN|nr:MULTISPECIES: Immediate-early protein 2 [Streptomyces]MEE4584278.1 SRPBCC family protein [Streptomyces sp. DSM 41602]AJZ84395.1 SRPBCC family protein [Streptomyces sp. AgN23]KUL45342.1 Immediate-early protein 2 [Streptomyces violaceusniger]RSS49864.1 SRPBCC family protein [Streptomyces sp. WAC05858]WJE01544.1 SRPBCC family protein [Streptomyces antimycoticus]